MTIVYLLLAGTIGFACGLLLLVRRASVGRHTGERVRVAARSQRALWIAAAAAAAAAIVAPAAPTGWVPLDAVIKAAGAAGLVLVASEVSPILILVVAALALLAAMGSSIQPVAAAASGLVIASLFTRRREPVVLGLSVALLVQVALRLDQPTVSGATAAAAALILLPLSVAGLVRLSPPYRPWAKRIALGAGAVVVVAGTLGTLSALLARRSLQRGVDLLTIGGAFSGSGTDLAARSNQFHAAAASFAQARSSLDSVWARPAEMVPLLSQQVRALRTAASTGEHLSNTATLAAGNIRAADIHIQGGQLPVAKITALEPTLTASAQSLAAAVAAVRASQSPWLLPPLADRLSRELARLQSTSATVQRAAEAIPKLPDLLGENGPRRYFLAIQTPSESRAAGGLLGGWGEITADGGHLRLTKFGHLNDLNVATPAASRHLVAPPDYVARYGHFLPEQDWSNINLSPDFPSDAAAIEGLYPQSGGQPIDGVIAIDPAGLAALLRVIGPVSVPAWPVPITADNAQQVLLYQQYAQAQPGNAAEVNRLDFLAALAQGTWERLTTGFSGSPQDLLTALGSAATGKHLMLAATRPSEEAVFKSLHVDGSMEPVQGDFLGVVTQNAGGDKLDWFLHRQVDYQVQFDPATGKLSAELTLTLRNDAPSSGPSPFFTSSGLDPPLPRGDNKLYLSLYTPWTVTSSTLEGKSVSLDSQTELGRRVYSGGLVVPAGQSLTLRVDLAGKLPGPQYRLVVFKQPTVNPDQVRTSVAVPWGWRLDTTGLAASKAQFPLTTDRILSIDLSRRRWIW
jgi:Protein of unknown function (DUF4012)